MAEAKKIKVRKKEWYAIVAKDVLNGAMLGESFVADQNELINKPIKVNLMQITNESRHQNTNIKFIIKSVENKNGIADIIGYELSNSTIRRFVRKEKKKIDLSFLCITSDGVAIRIKPIMVIKKNAKGSTQTVLRKQAISYLTKTIQKTDFKTFVNDLIFGKLQDGLRKHLSKFYPMKIMEIRHMSIITRADVQVPIIEEAQPAEIKETEDSKAETEIKAEEGN